MQERALQEDNPRSSEILALIENKNCYRRLMEIWQWSRGNIFGKSVAEKLR